jgi:hypothetical protein
MEVLEELSPYLGFNHFIVSLFDECTVTIWGENIGVSKKKFNHQIRYLFKGLGLLFT